MRLMINWISLLGNRESEPVSHSVSELIHLKLKCQSFLCIIFLLLLNSLSSFTLHSPMRYLGKFQDVQRKAHAKRASFSNYFNKLRLLKI